MAYEFLFANNATTTLSASVSATATVLNVASGDGDLFPSPASGQAFAVTLVDAETGLTNEICYCTARSGDALTVIRGQEGKNALAWSAGDTCANYITADVMESWLQESDLAGYLTETVGDSRYLMLSSTAIQTVTGPVTFSGTTLVPTVTDWAGKQAVGASDLAQSLTTFSPIASTQSITVPSWASRIEIQVIGGGGGGSNCQTTADTGNKSGGGGGSGEYRHGVYPCSSGQSVNFVIGNGGGSQSNGGSSSVSIGGVVAITAIAGFGASFAGSGISAGGGGGISGVGGNITSVYGTAGTDGQNGSMYFSGNGGNGIFGGGGRAGAKGGEDGSAFGAGGGGAYDPTNSGTQYLGGDGAPGLILFRFLP